VLDNLISNAFKYGAPGSDVVVTAARCGQDVEVSVINQGETLSAEEIQHLFARFYRTRSAGEERGLGLGLYIARGLVEAHGGRLWCESSDGQTTFHFTLPIGTVTSPEPPQPAA
jgi:signal transduction histidine kinase